MWLKARRANENNIATSCKSLFEIYGDEFVNYSSAVKPQFEIENSEFPSNSIGKLDMNDKEWQRIRTKHDFKTSSLMPSCAISEKSDLNGDYEVIPLSNDVNSDADFPSSIQKMTTVMP